MNADYEAFKARQQWWDARAKSVPKGSVGETADGGPVPWPTVQALVPLHRSERKSLRSAVDRCHFPHNQDFADYGGRGIAVCDEWRGPGGFDAFVAHIGPKPSLDHTLDRIDNTRGYEPGNVRWATWVQQANNRRSSKLITWRNETLSAADWARRQGLTRQEVANRINTGWPVDLALLLGAQPERESLLQAAAFIVRSGDPLNISPRWRQRIAEAIEATESIAIDLALGLIAAPHVVLAARVAQGGPDARRRAVQLAMLLMAAAEVSNENKSRAAAAAVESEATP